MLLCCFGKEISVLSQGGTRGQRKVTWGINTSLGNLFQCLITHMVKTFFLMFEPPLAQLCAISTHSVINYQGEEAITFSLLLPFIKSKTAMRSPLSLLSCRVDNPKCSQSFLIQNNFQSFSHFCCSPLITFKDFSILYYPSI